MSDYFVSISNSPYFHWQVDLLIESFKLLKLEDQLVIAIAKEDPVFKFKDYSKNLFAHKRVFVHPNFGAENGYLPLNLIRSLGWALENKVVSQPVVILHPDMVLTKPIKIDGKSSFYFDTYTTSSIEEFQEHLEPKIAKILELLPRTAAPAWLPLGDVFVMQAMPANFVYRWLERTIELKDEGKVKSPIKDGLALSLYDYLGYNVAYNGHLWQSILLDNHIQNVIHYGRGMPPVFNKTGYKQLGTGFAADDPLDVLLQHNPTPNTAFLQDVIRSYQI